ncbi:MAG TPA: SPOR domain-containing protein [Burkholderiaceae bacterium]
MNDPTFCRNGGLARSHRARFEARRGGFEGQRGGFAVGLIVGLLVGLALALGVALYVTKVPVPFIDKVPQRTAGQDAAEAAKNKNWDPNSPLYGKNPAKLNNAASGVVAPTPPVAEPSTATTTVTAPPPPPARAPAPASGRDTAVAAPADKSASAPRFAAAASAGGTADPFIYFVQAGAYGRTEDAEQQRAKLALLGLQARMTERDQSGRTVYRVRVGPFDRRADADAAKARLVAAGVEAALVRVQR